MKCHYCDNEATKQVIWLKDKHQRPARIALPWCGCDLMTALKRFWAVPCQIKEGWDYEVGVLPCASRPSLLSRAVTAVHSLWHPDSQNAVGLETHQTRS